MSGVDDRRWMAEAACTYFPADWWFPDGDPDPLELGRVREICLGCPVRRECLDYAVESDQRDPRAAHGIWAGLTDGQRSSLRRGVCVGCRRNEDPGLLWDRVGNWRETGSCGACDALRATYRTRRKERADEKKAAPKAPPPVPDVVLATVEWWSSQRPTIKL